ncbi:hypothetical protein A3E17_03705 [Candidatus Amesbacteria bacterium RIFCSPHIGHO2_12_FULL_48_14]|uniref:Polymerase nucleotidyl transferase domain-containing protein n=2 Tax=Candidatus Amesiibacteriota TaxID=1752730 RepID=A0A1F4Z793_9BACT|nr:MAG: hypothetical protein UY33_C0003G0052 [Candidatus Amesbacteria bacterium GW2011_GWA1_48_9]OGD02185.1 MAG: hypothetical protein A3E17_03705 [Candidatus Amesbacteria bacterium RIFCSPHIGHO2_12_FULL_48_14]
MLKPNQEKYLSTIPADKKVVIKPYDPKLREVADGIIRFVHGIDPDLEVLFMGAAGLGISGQGDLDLYILCKPSDFGKYLLGLKDVFGEPVKEKDTYVAWELVRDDVPVELYLTDLGNEIYNTSMKEQNDIFNILKTNPDILKEYEDLKISLNGQSFREYQRQKYKFYNRVLSQESNEK